MLFFTLLTPLHYWCTTVGDALHAVQCEMCCCNVNWRTAVVFRRCRGPGASRLQILLSKLCCSGVALCRCPPHCRPWSPSPSHTCSLLQVQHRPKKQLSHASCTVYSTHCSPALFYSILTCRVSFTLTGFSDSPDYSSMLWCELYYHLWPWSHK